MGKIKSKNVKRSAKIIKSNGIEFSEDFNTNKKILEGVVPSKKLRNQLAGLLVRVKKQDIEFQKKLLQAVKIKKE